MIDKLHNQKTLVESYEKNTMEKTVGLKADMESKLSGFKMT